MVKALEEFHAASYVKGRRHGYCKPCMRDRAAEHTREKYGLPLTATAEEVRRAAQASPIGAVREHKGYLYEKVGHDRSVHHRADKNGWVAQHILVAERTYGILVPGYLTVHHRDRDKLNNTPGNLELRVGPHGKGGDLMPTLLTHAESRESAIAVLRDMGYSVEKRDKLNVGGNGRSK